MRKENSIVRSGKARTRGAQVSPNHRACRGCGSANGFYLEGRNARIRMPFERWDVKRMRARHRAADRNRQDFPEAGKE
jgi:hypothetical protein